MSRNRRPPRHARGPFARATLVVPEALIEAMERLAAATGRSADAEWLRAADEHVIRVYRLIAAHPDEPAFPDATDQAIADFVAAARTHLRRSRQWPLRDML